jgi:hypothetical protein
MESITIRSVTGYVQHLEARFSGHENVLFRGHRDMRWKLEPGIARVNPRRPLLVVEEKLFHVFKRRSLPFLEMRPERDWDWLMVAQHHGLPTRLLDWSVNALAALWFVVEKPAIEGRPGAVWYFLPEAKDYLRSSKWPADFFENDEPGGGNEVRAVKTSVLDRVYVLVPRFVSRRIVAQGGYFTAHPSWNEAPHFRPMEDDPDLRHQLARIEVPAEHFGEIRYALNRLGVNSVSIYPDLPGLCNSIKWRYCFENDEEDDSAHGAAVAASPVDI